MKTNNLLTTLGECPAHKNWATFSSAPHRMFFFAGIMQSLLTLAWWMADLGGRYGDFYTPIAWSIPPADAHAFMMIYGFFPLFIFGFLMTTYPRWMNGEEVKRRHYVAAFLLLITGIMLFYIGLIVGKPLLMLALVVYLIGWAVGLYALLGVYVRAKNPDKRHAAITSVVLVVGWLLIAAFASNEVHLITLAKVGSIWLLLLPIFFTVSHRMIPFFSANVIPGYKVVRPGWALALVPAGALIHAILELNGLPQWTWLVDLPMAACAIYLTLVWQLRASLATPILAVLHIGFAWLGIAFLLYAGQSLVLLATDQLVLAKAPLHALTVGYFSSMLLAMVTRVTLGHSGRALEIDRTTWGIFLVFQLAPILRIAAELPGLGFTLRGHLQLCSGIIWLACFGLWSCKYVSIYWKPRPDGRQG
jgi:uncharacterized protein involved in response to NO